MNWTTADKLLLSAIVPSEASRARLGELLARRGGEVDWAQVVTRAESGYAGPLLRASLARAGQLGGLPRRERELLEAASHGWAARQLAYEHRAGALLHALAARGVTALPLKGAALMLGGYYPPTCPRVTADIDLLIDPARADEAKRVADECGFAEIAPHLLKIVRAAQPLMRERRHLPIRRGPGGIDLELHYRAFVAPRTGREFGFAEMTSRARRREVAGRELLLPAAEDLCLHLLQHTVVELWSAYAIPRTLADLHFVLRSEPQARPRLVERAEEFGLRGAAELTLGALSLIEEATPDEFDRIGGGTFKSHAERDAALLLDTMLGAPGDGVAETVRLFEYFDLRQPPREMLTNLRTLFAAPRPAGRPGVDAPPRRAGLRRLLELPSQFFHLLRRFSWAGLAPRRLRRVLKIRRLTHGGR
jgi:hypothetical protein